MDLYITGIGVVSALGSGINTLEAGLRGEKKPLIEERTIETKAGEKTISSHIAVMEGLEKFVPRQSLRRIDRFTQMSLLSSHLALEDSQLTIEDKTRMGIIFGSGYGSLSTSFSFLDALIDHGDKCASPTLFASSVHNSLASQAAISLKFQGPCLTITCFQETLFSVLLNAQMLFENEDVDHLLIGFGEEHCDVRNYATNQFGGGETRYISPFDSNQCSFLPGEGFVSFLLSKENNPRNYCKINGIKILTDLQEVPSDIDSLFLDCDGEKGKASSYQTLFNKDFHLRTYSPLFGGMPSGQAFDMAAAALSLKKETLFPLPENTVDNEVTLDSSSTIGLIGQRANMQYSLITLKK